MSVNGPAAIGRPPGANGIRATAARYAQAALGVLSEIAACERAPEADRVRAAEVILSHATRQPRASTSEDAT